MEESSHVVTMNVRVGSVLPVLSTAIGRLFAAYLPATTIRRFTAAERRRPAAHGRLPSDKTIAALLDDIRRRRLSRAHAPLLPGVDALAAPIFDHTGALVAVICAVGRPETLKAEWGGKLARAVGATADRLSGELGFSGGNRGRRDRLPRPGPA
jgi:DNA-binding IclR family transcriptional regulator